MSALASSQPHTPPGSALTNFKEQPQAHSRRWSCRGILSGWPGLLHQHPKGNADKEYGQKVENPYLHALTPKCNKKKVFGLLEGNEGMEKREGIHDLFLRLLDFATQHRPTSFSAVLSSSGRSTLMMSRSCGLAFTISKLRAWGLGENARIEKLGLIVHDRFSVLLAFLDPTPSKGPRLGCLNWLAC